LDIYESPIFIRISLICIDPSTLDCTHNLSTTLFIHTFQNLFLRMHLRTLDMG